VGEKQALCKYSLKRCELRVISNGLGGSQEASTEVKDSFLGVSEMRSVRAVIKKQNKAKK